MARGGPRRCRLSASRRTKVIVLIIDGDTVKVDGTRYRLAGIDAPENGQMALDDRGRPFDAGDAATNALANFLNVMQDRGWKAHIVWRDGDVDRYRRQLAHIEVVHRDGRTLDVCAWMVAEGWAVAEYGAQYRHLEREARRHRRGLWAGEFERPKDWRRARRGQPARTPARPEGPTLLGLVLVGTLQLVLALIGVSIRRTRYRRRRRRYW